MESSYHILAINFLDCKFWYSEACILLCKNETRRLFAWKFFISWFIFLFKKNGYYKNLSLNIATQRNTHYSPNE